MGSANVKAAVNNINKQVVISETTSNIINKSLNTAVANALITNNSLCRQTVKIDQIQDWSECHLKNINLNLTQKAFVQIDFSCLNVFKAEQAMAQALLSDLMNTAQNTLNAEALNKMNTNSESKAAAGPFALGSSSNIDSTVSNTFDLKHVNTTYTNLENIIANSITNNFNVESINECINQAKINQQQKFSKCDYIGGEAKLEQIAGVEGVVKCVNQSGTINDILQDVANKVGVQVVADTKSTSSNDMTTVLKNVADATGIPGCPGCGSCPPSEGSVVMLLIFVGLCVVLLCMSSSGYAYYKLK